MRVSKRWSSFASLAATWLIVAGCSVGCGGGGDSGTGTGGDDTGATGDTSGGDGTTDGAGDSSHADSTGDGSGDGSKDASDAKGDGSDGGGDTDVDTGSGDTGAGDTGGGADTGGGTDTGPADTGPLDTGVVDTGPPDTGPSPCGSGACTVDSDGDGIPDSVEGECITPPIDTDTDGTPDYLDLDSDGDTIPDQVEWAAGGCDPTAAFNDADGDGTPNFRDLDSDENGLPDLYEICPVGLSISGCGPSSPADTDGDGAPDWLDGENDHDSPSPDPTIGLEDKFELVDNTGAYKGPKVLVPYKTYDTTTPLIDTDADGVPDVWDRDADADNIFDLTDGLGDPDKDAIPNFRDGDSDGDGVKDVCEARANSDFTPSYAEAAKALLDTNGDGTPDYLQRDTDGDFLLDGAGPLGDPTTGEDKNSNCIVDSTETDRLKPDTDGDGVTDFIEVTLVDVACAKDPTCTPASKGKFYFLEPYSPDGSAAPTPTSSPLGLKTDLQKGDLGFIVDTTFSMDGEIAGLKTGLPTIISSLKAKLPDLGIGIAGHDDIPNGTNGVCTAPADKPFYLLTSVTTDATTATTAAAGLVVGNGADLPEDQVLAMMYAFTGTTFSWPAASGCAAGSLPTVASTATNFGALGFRVGALPMIMEISDAEFHNGQHATQVMPTIVLATPTTVDPTKSWQTYDPGSATGKYYLTTPMPYAFSASTITDLATALKAKGARFLGGAADDSRGVKSPTAASGAPTFAPANTTYYSGPTSGVAGVAGAISAARNLYYDYGAYGDMAYLADQTGSLVDPADFTHGATCAVGQCCTGFNGAGVAPDGAGGKCRLVFNVNHAGTGLGTQVVDAVVALLNAITFDVHVQANPCTTAGTPGCGATDTVDAVNAFMANVLPSPSGGVDPSIGTCISFTNPLADRYTGPKATAGGDGTNETILGVKPGPLYCFNVVPKANTTVVPTSTAQVFHAALQVIAENGSGTIPLGSPRTVLFLVPPIVN